MKDAIYIMKELKLNDIKQTSPLDKWFHEMVQKSIDELTTGDVTRMLRQEVYLDIAIPIAWKNIINNPFDGELYDGETLEMLIRVFKNNPEKIDNNLYSVFKKELCQKYNKYEWGSEYEKEEYDKLLVKFKQLFR